MTSTFVSASPEVNLPNPDCHTLRRDITALRLTKSRDLNYDFAVLTELPKGAELTVCGSGFNHRTVTVRWQDDSYYVFEQDLLPGDSSFL